MDLTSQAMKRTSMDFASRVPGSRRNDSIASLFVA